MSIKKIPCGGWLYDDEQITFEDGVMKVIGGGDIPPEVTNSVETHGMGWTDEEEVEGFDIQWDGNTEGLERFETYVKISDLDIPNDQIVGLKYDSSHSDTHEFFRTTEITQEIFEKFIEFENINDDYAILDYFIVVHKDGLVIEEQEIAHKGIYVPDGLHSDLYISRIYKEASTQEVVHQIDQKYIPQSSGGAMVVKVQISEDDLTFSADKTIAEIRTAYHSGQNVIAHTYTESGFIDWWLNLNEDSEGALVFGLPAKTEEVLYKLYAYSEDGVDTWGSEVLGNH